MAIGLIGGSGVYDPKLLKNVEQIKVQTPFGSTSDVVTSGVFKGKQIYIIPRHGSSHLYIPSNVPYRANIWALKKLGVTKIIGISAVGSLKEEIKPGDFVITDQLIDRTTKREQTIYGNVHISVAEPFCPTLRRLVNKKTHELNFPSHDRGTCVIIEGPRFSTKAESKLYQSWGADIINMTIIPEAVLAREAEICYVNISMVTDYDVWKEHVVSTEEILDTMKKNIDKVKKLLASVIPEIDDAEICPCNEALKNAVV